VVVAAEGSVMVSRDPDVFLSDQESASASSGDGSGGYRISKPALPDPSLSTALVAALKVKERKAVKEVGLYPRRVGGDIDDARSWRLW
jgi:hypothetical protein